MFNKSTFANRNEPITRKDVKTVLGGTTGNLTTAAGEPVPETAPETKTVHEAPLPASATVVSEPNTATENLMGARLIVGPDVKLKGAEILDCDTLVVEGRVEATMDSRVIRIADKGSFAGKVSIDIAEIHGSFEGELTARAQLIIHATGKVHGKIRYGKLVIDEGGELCGDINTLSSEKKPHSSQRDEAVLSLSAVAG